MPPELDSDWLASKGSSGAPREGENGTGVVLHELQLTADQACVTGDGSLPMSRGRDRVSYCAGSVSKVIVVDRVFYFMPPCLVEVAVQHTTKWSVHDDPLRKEAGRGRVKHDRCWSSTTSIHQASAPSPPSTSPSWLLRTALTCRTKSALKASLPHFPAQRLASMQYRPVEAANIHRQGSS